VSSARDVISACDCNFIHDLVEFVVVNEIVNIAIRGLATINISVIFAGKSQMAFLLLCGTVIHTLGHFCLYELGLYLLKALTYKLRFWCAGTSSDYLG